MRVLAAILLAWALVGQAMAQSNGPSSNPRRAYPPSCLSVPIVTRQVEGPQTTVDVLSKTVAFGQTVSLRVYLFRIACEGGSSAFIGFVLPLSNLGGDTAYSPAFRVTQGNVVRQVVLPNRVPNVESISPYIGQNGAVFVFDNSPEPAPIVYFSRSFLLEIDPSFFPATTLSIPAYDSSLYPSASLPMPISGYHSGNWFDPAHSGEGIQIEVGEFPEAGAQNNRYVTVAWYTFDKAGTPFWLFGSGVFTAGDRSAQFQLGYSTQGGFAGNFGAQASASLWGTFALSFPDCNTIQFAYQSVAGLPSYVPSGSGTKQWTRVTSINGLDCR